MPTTAPPTRPATSTPLVRVAYRPARDTLITSGGFLTVSVAGAVSSLLLLLVVGAGPDTDAVVAGYSLFLVVSLFAATVRPVLVPAYGAVDPETAFRARVADLGGRTGVVGVAAGGAVLVLTPLAVVLFAGTIQAASRGVLVTGLLLLAPAGWLQIRAAAGSSALAAVNRFTTSALAYAAASLVAVGSTAVLLVAVGPLGLPAGALVGSVALAAGHEAATRRLGLRLQESPRRLGQRTQWTFTRGLLVAAAVPLAWHAQLVVSLAFVSDVPGEVTAYAYGYYLVVAYLTAPASASMVTLPRLVERLGGDRRGALSGYVATVTPPGLVLVSALMAATVAFGEPVASSLLSGSLEPAQVTTLMDVILALSGMAVAQSLLLILWPTAAAMGRQGRLALVAVATLALMAAGAALVRGHTAQVALVQSGASVLTTAGACVVLLGRAAGATVGRVAVRAVPALVCLGVVAGVRLLAGDGSGPAGAMALAAGGLALSGLVCALLWPSMMAGVPVLGALSRRSPFRRTGVA